MSFLHSRRFVSAFVGSAQRKHFSSKTDDVQRGSNVKCSDMHVALRAQAVQVSQLSEAVAIFSLDVDALQSEMHVQRTLCSQSIHTLQSLQTDFHALKESVERLERQCASAPTTTPKGPRVRS